MNKTDEQNFRSIIRTINKNVVVSFLIALLFFLMIMSVIFVEYKVNEKKIISQKINATISAFVNNISQKLIPITTLRDFKNYIDSGKLSRDGHYTRILSRMHVLANLRVFAGMEIFDNAGMNIFTYGEVTEDYVVLDLCYLNRSVLNFKVGNCEYSWKLYFRRDVVVEELKKLNPELIECNNCGIEVVTGECFGGFPVSQLSGMKVNLTIKRDSALILGIIIFFMINLLLVLVIWNVNRIKLSFRKYFSDPILELIDKIKNNKKLSSTNVEELSYLTNQIAQWKSQVVELERTKAKEKATEEKVKIMQAIGASIAHELRTPLRSIVSAVVGFKKLLPALLENYRLARKANLPAKVINPQKIEQLHKVLAGLEKEGLSANVIIDMFLMKMRGTVAKTFDKKQLSIADCVNETLERYSFQEQERSLVVYDASNDFQIKGDRILVVHILFNLLKNALYYIASVNKGKIYIHLERRKDENILYFKDTGKGMAGDVLPRIFDKFYSNTEGGVGIGLSFCKMAMEWMGGYITCQSVEGEYTEFILHFPKLKG